MTYDPTAYWRARGATYEAKFRGERYAEQEDAIARLVGSLQFDSVLEVGCGFGRIGWLICDMRPGVAYTGIDLSPDLLASARERIPDGTFVETDIADFRPDGRFDLVIASEVLMHVRPEDIGSVVRKMDRLAARHLVTVDWTRPLPRMKVAAHNFLHDYRALLGTGQFGRAREVNVIPVGLQSIHHVAK